MAGIKFHAAIDTLIANNHIYNTCLGLWLDWMAQGTRVARNLFHDNSRDLFVEVNHGPFVVDNNLFLSGAKPSRRVPGRSLRAQFVCGNDGQRPGTKPGNTLSPAPHHHCCRSHQYKGRLFPFLQQYFRQPGRTQSTITCTALPFTTNGSFRPSTGGNVYYNGAQPYKLETNPTVVSYYDPKLSLDRDNNERALTPEPSGSNSKRPLKAR